MIIGSSGRQHRHFFIEQEQEMGGFDETVKAEKTRDQCFIEDLEQPCDFDEKS